MPRNWHGFSATQPHLSGTFSVPVGRFNLAPFFVPDADRNVAPLPCHIPGTVSVPHSRTLTSELIPSGTTCQTDVSIYRSLRRPTLTYRTNEVTTDRTRREVKL